MFKDKTVLVTGASSGIGAALARRFAKDGARLMLVARREDRLRALAEELGAAASEHSEPGRQRPGHSSESGSQPLMHTVEAPQRVHPVKLIVADLVEDGACERVVSEATAAMGVIDVLVNNAGVGEYGRFVEQAPAALDRMMRLNMVAVVRLTHLVLPAMVSRRSGWIMNIASAAAFQPTPYMGVYGATKSFVLDFSMSLWEEVRRKGVVVTCVCPGPVKTGFFDRGGYETRTRDYSQWMKEADWIAEAAYTALAKKKPVCLPGWAGAMGVFLQRFVPLKAVTRLSGRVLRPE